MPVGLAPSRGMLLVTHSLSPSAAQETGLGCVTFPKGKTAAAGGLSLGFLARKQGY